MTRQEKRIFKRIPDDRDIAFTVLSVESSRFRRIPSAGRIIDKCPEGVGLITEFPLEPGHVLEWDDDRSRGNLHIAMVKWSCRQEKDFRAGLYYL